MKKLPLRTLTVTQGRDTIGFINKIEERQFVALLLNGKSVGVYPSSSDAAQAISNHPNNSKSRGK